jgi:hypothetical protein
MNDEQLLIEMASMLLDATRQATEAIRALEAAEHELRVQESALGCALLRIEDLEDIYLKKQDLSGYHKALAPLDFLWKEDKVAPLVACECGHAAFELVEHEECYALSARCLSCGKIGTVYYE